MDRHGQLRAKSTTQSHRSAVFYVDLCLRDGIALAEAVKQAKAEAERQIEAGVEVDALEVAARTALANGAFEDSDEEGTAIVEEFFPEEIAGAGNGQAASAADVSSQTEPPTKPKLVPRSSKLTDRLGPGNAAASATGSTESLNI